MCKHTKSPSSPWLRGPLTLCDPFLRNHDSIYQHIWTWILFSSLQSGLQRSLLVEEFENKVAVLLLLSIFVCIYIGAWSCCFGSSCKSDCVCLT